MPIIPRLLGLSGSCGCPRRGLSRDLYPFGIGDGNKRPPGAASIAPCNIGAAAASNPIGGGENNWDFTEIFFKIPHLVAPPEAGIAAQPRRDVNKAIAVMVLMVQLSAGSAVRDHQPDHDVRWLAVALTGRKVHGAVVGGSIRRHQRHSKGFPFLASGEWVRRLNGEN